MGRKLKEFNTSEVTPEEKIEEKNKNGRKGIIRDALLKAMKHKSLFKGGIFEEERCFDMQKVVQLPGTKGLLRESVPDFKPEDKRIFREVLQDFKKEKILFHKTGSLWAWERTK